MSSPRRKNYRRTLMRLSLSAYLVLGCYLVVARVLFPDDNGSAVTAPQQSPPYRPLPIQEPIEADVNRYFKIVPANFTHIDFENYSYGPYWLVSGKRIDLVLKGGERKYDLSSDLGWFSLMDVYYADVTGDGSPEAIVVLSHVQCGGGSCDGGATLFYIYTARDRELQGIWKYETGSSGYGCGLSSFSTEDKQIVLEVFGRCPQPAADYPGSEKFVIGDLTRLVFRFNGQRFVRTKLKFLSAPNRDVKNYEPQIRIGGAIDPHAARAAGLLFN